MVRLASVRKSVTAPQAAQLFVDNVFRNHGLPEAFVSDRDPRFVSHFWQHLFRLLGTRLDMSTAGHPQTDGQTERVNRVLEDILRSVCAAEPTTWSTLLSQVEFALNNAVHSSTGFTPFYVNGLRHPRTPLTLTPASSLGGGEANAEDPRGLKGLRTSVKRNLLSFIETGEAVRQRERDAMAAAQDTQKEQSDRQGRKNTQHQAATSLREAVHGHRVHGYAYTLDLPSSMATHPTFYIGLLKPYRPSGAVDPEEPTASQSSDGRRSPSSEQALSREAEQGRELEPDQEDEPLRGIPAVRPSGPHDRTERGSSQCASPGPGVPARRSPRLANIGSASGQHRHAISQTVQVPAAILELLQVGLRILDANAKRHHLGPLAIQQLLTGLSSTQKALLVRARASRATLSVLVRHHSCCGLHRLCLVMRASTATMLRSY
ncbi:hypothetical protein PF005_g4797 [Phytophthora fragariae]|uniref:Integrase catalytic domain-containing protein n=1 Tax=Phytophthora fragariae TaxID=53985 RepID=A0A6A3LX93_9STRA|nr:hypothetical protein PF011_g3840 [Phytophthora fragariae]KAE9227277.1 hypothetical protein PF005_g4797 [Phytophthora fragariae]KAE9248773.1 hypothetical protein PF002_g5628 [Phytophthora fragariae]